MIFIVTRCSYYWAVCYVGIYSLCLIFLWNNSDCNLSHKLKGSVTVLYQYSWILEGMSMLSHISEWSYWQWAEGHGPVSTRLLFCRGWRRLTGTVDRGCAGGCLFWKNPWYAPFTAGVWHFGFSSDASILTLWIKQNIGILYAVKCSIFSAIWHL